MRKFITVLVVLLMTATQVFAGGRQSTATTGTLPVKLTVEIFDRGTDGGRTKADDNAWTAWVKDKVLKDLNIEVT
ncbi:MAG: hypothetical protein LBB81_07425, partial [Treponema sp.]|nr:hypothetical protein [Treponema sp.]